MSRGSIDASTQETRTRAPTANKEQPQTKPFQSRFLHNKSTPTPPPPVKDDEETETTSEEETESEEDSDDNTQTKKVDPKEIAKSDIGPLLARSANARDSSAENARKSSREETAPYTPRSRYAPKEESPPKKYSRSKPVQEEEPPKYGYTSRFLNKSKSSATIPPDEEDHKYGATQAEDSDSKYPSGRSRYMALKERRQRLARSKSSQQFGDDEDVDEPISPTSSNPTAYLASRGYGSAASSGHDISRSRSSHALKSRDNSPERSNTTEKDGAALSSWARYLKNKYGNRNSTKDKESNSSSINPSSSSATARRLSLGLPLRSSTELGSSDDDQKNMQGSPTTPPTAVTAAAGKHFLFFIMLNRHFYWFSVKFRINTDFPQVQ